MQNPFIIGERIYLRPIEIEDAARYASWLNDPEVRPGVGRTSPLSQLNEEEIIRGMHQKPNQQIMAICEKETDTHVGGTGVHSIDTVDRSCSFGIFIGDRERWSRGYATEATRLVLRHAFETLNLNRVQLNVFSYNPRAIGIYERVGFKRDGVLRQARYHAGEFHDDIVMSVLREEWDAGLPS